MNHFRQQLIATQLLMLGSLSKRISMPNFQGNAAGTVESKLTLGKYDEQGNYDESSIAYTLQHSRL